MLTLSHPSLQFVRGFAGAVLFSFPMLMTMEMWSLGVSIEPARLMLFVVVHLVLLAGMASYARHDEAVVTTRDVLDAFAAYGVGVLAAVPVLFLFDVVDTGMSISAITRTIAVQAAPAAFGAMVAHLEIDEPAADIGPGHPHGFASSAFLMAVGALYLCSSLASTEEMMLIAYKMSVWQIGGLMVFSLVMMQLFDEYAIEQDLGGAGGESAWSASLAMTAIGYAIALVISVYILWTFGRTDGLTIAQLVKEMIVLGFPAALGAGAARLLF
ncbi:MAG TPA: TIGR02587 family membrane protein [Vicinamibacterales bacterium]|nr:TIGR02587 family membrane protein [Vicinamibacterales bacterium]